MEITSINPESCGSSCDHVRVHNNHYYDEMISHAGVVFHTPHWGLYVDYIGGGYGRGITASVSYLGGSDVVDLPLYHLGSF